MKASEKGLHSQSDAFLDNAKTARGCSDDEHALRLFGEVGQVRIAAVALECGDARVDGKDSLSVRFQRAVVGVGRVFAAIGHADHSDLFEAKELLGPFQEGDLRHAKPYTRWE